MKLQNVCCEVSGFEKGFPNYLWLQPLADRSNAAPSIELHVQFDLRLRENSAFYFIRTTAVPLFGRLHGDREI